MYSENGTYYVPHPASINYTADPSPELDKAWEELTWGTIRNQTTRNAHVVATSNTSRSLHRPE